MEYIMFLIGFPFALVGGLFIFYLVIMELPGAVRRALEFLQ